MSDNLISQYIDNELSLDDKIIFVETVHANRAFKEDAVTLLRQEQLIRSDVVDRLPSVRLKESTASWYLRMFRPVAAATAASLAIAALLIFFLSPVPGPSLRPYRFVLYQPDTERVELAGSFSGWKRIPLSLTGPGGYWETTLELPPGEHRFSYIVEGGRRLTDPTIAVREIDDFGGENSILRVRL